MISCSFEQTDTAMRPLPPIPPHSPSHFPEGLEPSVNQKISSKDILSPQPEESVSLSQEEKEILDYTKAMKQLPNVRTQRIAEIQKTLSQGQYSVSAEDLADKMIQEIPTPPPSRT